MRVHPIVWLLRATWLIVPFTGGVVLGVAFAPHSRSVQLVATALAWVLWGFVAVSCAAPHPVSLTVVRTLTPLGPAAIAWALVAADSSSLSGSATAEGAVGLVAATIACVCALSGATADEFVNAMAYGDERRFALRVPGMFLLASIPLMWLTTTAALLAGPLLLATRQWISGAAVCLVGVALVVLAARSFHGLSKRVAVFVPAGMTLVDPLALVDPMLFARKRTVRFGPALTDSDALDLSQNALGLALEVGLDAPGELTVRRGRSRAEMATASAVVFTPARPAAVLAEAARRGLVD